MSNRRNATSAQRIWRVVRQFRTVADAYDTGTYNFRDARTGETFFFWRPSEVGLRVRRIVRRTVFVDTFQMEARS